MKTTNLTKRTFLKISTAIFGLASTYSLTKYFKKQILVNKENTAIINIHTPNKKIGHSIRDNQILVKNITAQPIKINTLIVGGGVGGLSAAHTFSKHNFKDWILLELEQKVGGNSSSSNFGFGEGPTGAHYLPFQNKESLFMLDLLEDLNVLKNKENPQYNEEHVLHKEESRLFLYNKWVDDINSHPQTLDEKNKNKKLTDIIEKLKNTKGSDDRYLFTIPTPFCSQDKDLIKQYDYLHHISMKDWLIAQDINIECMNIHWYINYCCKDDYGFDSSHVSAWAGLLYFCGRRNFSTQDNPTDLLTWTEGLGWITKKIKETNQYQENFKTNTAVIKIKKTNSHYVVVSLNTQTNETTTYHANNIIWGAPTFLLKHIFPSPTPKIEYAPWVVANIQLNNPIQQEYWDNVWMNGLGLGYISTEHQEIKQYNHSKRITYYLTVDWFKTPTAARKWIDNATKEELYDLIIKDISTVMANIHENTQQMDIFLRPHAMAIPLTNITKHPTPNAKLYNQDFYLANSDQSQLSVFEEANYWGTISAKSILEKPSF